MDNELGTSIEADTNLAALGDGWTKSLKNIPEFSYQKLEEHLVLDAKKTPDPMEAYLQFQILCLPLLYHLVEVVSGCHSHLLTAYLKYCQHKVLK